MAVNYKKLLNDYALAWNSHDVNKILSFYTDDCVFEDVAQGIAHHGKKELTSFIKSVFVDFPDFKLEVKSLFESGDWAGSEYVESGTHANSTMVNNMIPATGKTFSYRAASIFQLRNGKISRQSEYWNIMTFLQQIGLMPGQPK